MPVIDDDSHPDTLDGIKELFLDAGQEDGEAHEAYYERDSKQLVNSFERTDFWIEFGIELANLSERRKVEGGLPLLAHEKTSPIVVSKPWESLLNKCYRANVLNNKNFPKPPPDGWITEKNWLYRIHDIVRTTVVVRYLEDISTVITLLEKVAVANGPVELEVDHKARDEGYYAVHVSIPMRLQYGSSGWESLFANIQVELQLCTQIQEVLRLLTHDLYRKRRVEPLVPGYRWQWDCESDEFVLNYLGHMLHYADGMIMNSRLRISNG